MQVPPGRAPPLDRRSLAVVLLAVLAGCGGISASDGGGERATLTPAPVPDDGPAALEGVMSDRIDGEILVANHEATLANTSYTAIETLRMGPPENATYERRTVMSVAKGGAPFHVEETVDGPITRVSSVATDVYWNGEYAYFRQPWGGGESVHYDRRSQPSDTLEIEGQLTDLLASVSVASVERGDGDATIVSGSLENASALPRRDGLSEAHNATLTMRIESDGIISRMAIGYDAEDYYDGRHRVRYTYRVTDVGETTVERPEWLEKFDDIDDADDTSG